MQLTPKQEAERLINLFFQSQIEILNKKGIAELEQVEWDIAVASALFLIEEKINYHDSLFDLGLKNVHQTMNTPVEMYNHVMNPSKKYLQQVKKEIENFKN